MAVEEGAVWSAVVLAGGTAARLDGVDKAGVEIGGRTLLEHVLAALAGAAEVVVVGESVPTSVPVTFTRESPERVRVTNAERVALDGRELMADPTLRSVMLLLGYEQIGDEVPVNLDAVLVRR